MTEAEQQARIYRNVVIVTMSVVTLLFSVLALFQPSLAQRAMFAISLIDGSGLIGLWMSRRGHHRAASIVFMAVLIGLVAGMALSAGGIRSPGMALFLVFTILG